MGFSWARTAVALKLQTGVDSLAVKGKGFSPFNSPQSHYCVYLRRLLCLPLKDLN